MRGVDTTPNDEKGERKVLEESEKIKQTPKKLTENRRI